MTEAIDGLEPVLQESTPSLIAGRVREAIGSGRISPGSQLHEATLAKQLGVSRGPLREGLQRLTQEGLLISYRNRGVFVTEMTPQNVRDMYLAREAVERAAAAEVHRIDPEAVREELLTVVEAMGEGAAADDVVAVGEADLRFHQVMVDGANSPRLQRSHETLLTETRMCIHALKESYSIHESRVIEHRILAESFYSGNAQRTDALLVEHMNDALDRLM
ncbi:MAG TPA: GntR family transcriptional regulator [Beutenbergiaceae bacterium]|nr:GntR family transcriptional regulator [Beutenbergiaceae bacterium]